MVAGVVLTMTWWVAALAVAKRVDAAAYWGVDLDHPYLGSAVGTIGAYLYSPAFAQALAPLRLLPLDVFFVLWSAALLGSLAWLARAWTPLVVLLPPVVADLMLGNIHAFLAVAIVLGFRYPAAWALVLLTKVTPGIGLLWFLVRREWRDLGIALGATAVIAAVSFALAPHLWFEWAGTLVANMGRSIPADIPLTTAQPIPLWLRLSVAVPIVIWGARTDRRWTVPLACYLALPVLWTTGQILLVAIIPLLAARRSASDGHGRGGHERLVASSDA